MPAAPEDGEVEENWRIIALAIKKEKEQGVSGDGSTNIQVAVRARPQNKKELSLGEEPVVMMQGPVVALKEGAAGDDDDGGGGKDNKPQSFT